MNARRQLVCTATVRAGHRTYFFDVETDPEGEPFLVVNESNRTPSNEFSRHKIIVAAEHVEQFFATLNSVLIKAGFLETPRPDVPVERERRSVSAPASEKPKCLAEIRAEHPNAYLPWTADEDQRLIGAFNACNDIRTLSVQFGRKPGGITSRLRKLGLGT